MINFGQIFVSFSGLSAVRAGLDTQQSCVHHQLLVAQPCGNPVGNDVGPIWHCTLLVQPEAAAGQEAQQTQCPTQALSQMRKSD